MRKIYYSLVAALLMTAGTVSAQTDLKAQFAESMTRENVFSVAGASADQTARPFSTTSNAISKVSEDEEVITDQPEGTLYSNMFKECYAYQYVFGSTLLSTVKGGIGDIVVADDAVYVKNPIWQYRTSSWMKCEKAEGDTVVVHTPFYIYYGYNDEVDDDIDQFLYLVKLTENSDGSLSYETLDDDIKFVWRDNTLTMVSEGMLGLCREGGTWTGYGDYDIVYSMPEDLITMGEDDEVQTYFMSYSNASGTACSEIVNAHIDGNDFYIGNLSGADETAYIKGTIDGDKVTFPSQQYIGVNTQSSYHVYFNAATLVDSYAYSSDALVFDYDAENGILSSDSLFYVTKGKELTSSSAINTFNTPVLEAWTETAATPTDPSGVYYADFGGGWGCGGAVLLSVDTDGKAMNPDKLFYNIYFDDEVHTFTQDEGYTYITEPITDIPYDFTSGSDFFITGTDYAVWLYSSMEKLGYQMIYRGGGEEHKSNIVYSDGTVVDGISSVVTDSAKTAAKVSYTDLSGRRVATPGKGIYVKSVSYTDGTTESVKVVLK